MTLTRYQQQWTQRIGKSIRCRHLQLAAARSATWCQAQWSLPSHAMNFQRFGQVPTVVAGAAMPATIPGCYAALVCQCPAQCWPALSFRRSNALKRHVSPGAWHPALTSQGSDDVQRLIAVLSAVPCTVVLRTDDNKGTERRWSIGVRFDW